MVSSRADYSTRLMVANVIVMSKVYYLIQLWGGCETYLIHSLQVQLNRAASQALDGKLWLAKCEAACCLPDCHHDTQNHED